MQGASFRGVTCLISERAATRLQSLRNFRTAGACATTNGPISTLVSELIERMPRKDEKENPSDIFETDISTKDVLKIIKRKLYETKEWPHVDPTPGESGSCQLIAAFLNCQLAKINKIDLENCAEEETRCLLPLVKAFILQEYHNPKNYESLSNKSVRQRLKDLQLTREKRPLSNNQGDHVLKRMQESFKQDLFCFYETNQFASTEESMEAAMDTIHQNDCYVFLRYYDGTPCRPDIFSSVSSRYMGHLYRRCGADPEKWRKMSTEQWTDLLRDNDQKTIVQVHFEYQSDIRDLREALDQKPQVKKIVERNVKANTSHDFPDRLGFGDTEFDLRDFVMQGMRAIHDPDLDFCDPRHPVTGPCHFSVVPGIKNLAPLLSFSLYYNEIQQRWGILNNYHARTNFSYAPLKIERYVEHWRNKSPHNPTTWVLTRRFKNSELTLSLAYGDKTVIDPRYSSFIIKEEISNKKELPVLGDELVENYKRFINTVVRPLTSPCYLYPQARHLLKSAKITQETIDALLQPSFIDELLSDR